MPIRKIWKYEIKPLADHVLIAEIEMPDGAELLDVQMQNQPPGGMANPKPGPRVDVPVLWALVDPEARLVTRTFIIVGTGAPFDITGCHYVATFQPTLNLVFHLFERKEEKNP